MTIRQDVEDGDYWEEVQGLADHLHQGALDGLIIGCDAFERELENMLGGSNYVNEPVMAAIALRCSKHPAAYFANGRHDIRWLASLRDREPFPFACFAAPAMRQDVLEKYNERVREHNLAAQAEEELHGQEENEHAPPGH